MGREVCVGKLAFVGKTAGASDEKTRKRLVSLENVDSD
jgi:hypothetical protein